MNWEFALRLLQFVAVASRPLRVEELAELHAFDFKIGPIPKFQEDRRLKDPVHAVLSICSSFLAIVDGGYYSGKVIQFSHFSVKEFLTSSRLVEESDIILHRYHVSMTPAHTLAAQTCLGVLLHLDKDVITRDNLKKWPLAEYAAEHWVGHAQIEDVSRNVEDGMKQLFNPSKPHLAVCVWIHEPDPQHVRFDLFRFGNRPERPLPLLRTSLQYAAVWGLDSIIKFLITELSQTVRSESFIETETPLHLASQYGHMKAACALIDHGADVSARNKDGQTSLHLTSRLGRVEVTCMLIERGADVSAQDKCGQTPLHLTLRSGQVESIRMLLEHGADASAQDKYGGTPLHLASQWGQVEVARMLLEHGADVSAQSKYGETPLHPASQYGRVEVACVLLERGVDVSAEDKDKRTPLHLASQWGQVAVVRMLLERGVDVSPQNKYGRTPLHLALQWRQIEVVRMLIEHGADVSAQDKDRQTSLHLASQWGQVAVARMLIERGADVSAQNKYGRTPLHLALEWRRIELARMLLEHGADVSAQDKNKGTPLHLASQRGQVEVARTLLERSADVSAQDEDGQTALHLASKLGQVEVTRVLIEHGADATSQNGKGDTPLHFLSTQSWSWRAQHCAIVADILLKHGADVNARNKDGLTPFCLASQVGFGQVTRVLLEHGADPGEIPALESPPITSQAHTLVDPSPIPSRPLLTTPNVAETPPELEPPSKDVLPFERHRPLFCFTRRFLYSMGIVAVAVALPFFYKVSRRR